MKNEHRKPVGPIHPRHNFSTFGGQYSFGDKPRGQRGGVWHTGGGFRLWSGYHPDDLTPGELYEMCGSIRRDLEIAYPSLVEDNEEDS